MDELQRYISVDRFRVAVLSLKGAAFQVWCVRLAGHAFGADFDDVRPYGRDGDRAAPPLGRSAMSLAALADGETVSNSGGAVPVIRQPAEPSLRGGNEVEQARRRMK